MTDSSSDYRAYSCEACTAACTFEAMQMCQLSASECPLLQGLKMGTVIDRRPTDMDPNFPSEFSYARAP